MSPFLTMGWMLGRGRPGWNWNLGNALYADCEDGARQPGANEPGTSRDSNARLPQYRWRVLQDGP